MTRIAWERYEGNDIEAVIAMLINLEHPNSVRITPSKGDGGVDILDRGAGKNGGDVVYQVKRYAKPLTTGQQNKVEESRKRLLSDPRWAGLNVTEWRLVTPWDPTPEAEAWLQNLGNESCEVFWHGLTFVESLASKHPEVIDYYLEGGRSRVEEAYKAALALFAPAASGEVLDVPSVVSRLNQALAVLKNDPHYRYELRFGEGELPTAVERPGLMLTWIQSEGPGKGWHAVDVIARCAASPDERPIVVSGTVIADKDSALAAALQDFRDYGTPFSAPLGAFTGSIDAPGGLGGSLDNAAMQVLPIPGDVGDSPELVLQSRSPAGVPIAQTEVVRTERSEGAKGIRVVLRQQNNVFTIEDHYDLPRAGRRQFRFGDFSNQPALEVRDALAFIDSVTPPNVVTVRRKGAPARAGSTDPNWNIQFPVEVRDVLDGVAAPVDALARLQEHTGEIVRVPDLTKTTVSAVQAWQRAARILDGEEVTGTYPEGHALGIEVEAEVESMPGLVAVEVPLDVVIGEQTIDFGPIRMLIEGATILEQREVDGQWVVWFTTPDRKVRYSSHATAPADDPQQMQS